MAYPLARHVRSGFEIWSFQSNEQVRVVTRSLSRVEVARAHMGLPQLYETTLLYQKLAQMGEKNRVASRSWRMGFRLFDCSGPHEILPRSFSQKSGKPVRPTFPIFGKTKQPVYRKKQLMPSGPLSPSSPAWNRTAVGPCASQQARTASTVGAT